MSAANVRTCVVRMLLGLFAACIGIGSALGGQAARIGQDPGVEACSVALLGNGITNLLGKPALSSDGSRVAVSTSADLLGRNIDTSIEVVLINNVAGNSTFFQVTESPGSILGGFNLAPSLSADGSRLAFFSDRNLTGGNGDGNFELFVARITGGGAISLVQNTTTTFGANTFPSMLADGLAVAFASDRDLVGDGQLGTNQIYLAQLDASGALASVRKITQLPVGQDADSPAQGGNGTRLVYVANDASSFGTQTDVYLALVDGTAITNTRVTNHVGNEAFVEPTLSGDGRTMAYVHQTSNFASEIIVVDITTPSLPITRAIQPLFGTLNKHPSLNEDGSRLVYSAQALSGTRVLSANVILLDLNSGLHAPIDQIDPDAIPNMNSAGTKVVYARNNAVYIATCGIADIGIRAIANLPRGVALGDPLLAGNVVTQTFEVINNGPTEAGSVSFDWLAGAGYTTTIGLDNVAAMSTTRGSCNVGLLRCNLGQMFQNERVTLTVIMAVDVGRGEPITSVASARAVAVDRIPANNAVTLTNQIDGPANLLVEFVNSGATVVAGTRVTATMVVSNAGPIANTSGAIVTFTAPADTQVVSVSTGCVIVAPGARCNMAGVQVGVPITHRIGLSVSASARGAIGGSAVTGGRFDLPANDGDALNLIATGVSDLGVIKSAVFRGDAVTFTVQVTNAGPSVGTGIVFTDVLPSELGVTSADQTDDDATLLGFGGGRRFDRTRVVGGQLALAQGLHLRDTPVWFSQAGQLINLEFESDLLPQSDRIALTDHGSYGGTFECGGTGSECPQLLGNGVIGNYMAFGPANSLVEGGGRSVGANDFTIMGWVYPDGFSTRGLIMSTRWPGCYPPTFYTDALGYFPFNRGFQLGLNPTGSGESSLFFEPTLEGTCQTYATPRNSVPAGKWSHFAVVVRNANPGEGVQIFINGVRVLSSDNSQFPFWIHDRAGATARIGGNAYFPVFENLRGKLDEFAIYNRTLSDTDIKLVYETQLPQRGEFDSRVIDASQPNAWTALNWFGQRPMGQNLPDQRGSDLSAVYAEGRVNMSALGNRVLWHLDEGNDSPPLDTHGPPSMTWTCTGACAGSVPGVLGFARKFEGTQKASIPLQLDKNFSVAFWMRTTDLGTLSDSAPWHAAVPIFDAFNTSNSGDRSWAISLANGVPQFGTNKAVSGSPTLRGTRRIADGNWHHIVATRNTNGSEWLYLDGQLVGAQTTDSTGDLVVPGALIIGNDRIGGSGWKGELDEIAIFTTTISAQSVADIFARGAAKVEFQVRACTDFVCGTNPPFVGPDGTAGTRYANPLTGTNVPLIGVAPSQFLQYRAFINNSYPNWVYHAVERVKALPDQFPFSSTEGIDCTPNSTSIVCVAPSLDVGEVVTAAFRTDVLNNASRVVNNVARVSGAEPDPILRSNTFTVPVGINGTNLKLTMISPTAPVTPGLPLSFSALFTNTHPDTAANQVRISITHGGALSDFVVAPQIVIISTDPLITQTVPLNCSPQSGNVGVICNWPNLNPGQFGRIDFSGKVPPAFGGSVTIQAGISTNNIEETLADNVARVSYAIPRNVNLQMTVQAPVYANVGSTLTYTVRITNTGPSDASTLQFADVPPSGSFFVPLAAPAISYGSCVGTGSNYLCDINGLLAGQSLTFTVRGTVVGAGQLVNSGVLIGAEVPVNIVVSRTVTSLVYPTTIALSPATSQVIHVGDPFSIVANVSPGMASTPLTYVWVLGITQVRNVTLSSISDTYSPTFVAADASATPRNLSVTATNAAGVSVSDNVSLLVVLDPTSVEIDVGGEQTIVTTTVDQSITLNSVVLPANATGPFTRTWEFSDPPSPAPPASTNATAIVDWNSAGTKFITLTVNSPYGVVLTDTFTVRVLRRPPASVAITPPAPFMLVGVPRVFTATVSPSNTSLPINYVWEFSGGPIAITHTGVMSRVDSVNVSWPITGSFRITVTVDNGIGPSPTDSDNVLVQ